MKDLYRALEQILELFESQSIAYTLIGGIAVRAHAIPRNTVDIDLVVAVDDDRRIKLLHILAQMGFEIAEPYLKGWMDRVRGMRLMKIKTYFEGNGIDVDIFLVESAFQHSLMQRRIPVEIGGRTVWIATAEDLLLLKLLASRPRDLVDAGDILFISGQLNLSYMRKWASELGVEAQLEGLLADDTGSSTDSG